MTRKGYVVYNAPTQFNTKTITGAQWAQAGVDDQETAHWGAENNWKIPAERFSDAAWPFIEADPSLRYEGGEDDRAPVSESEVRESAGSGTKRGRR